LAHSIQEIVNGRTAPRRHSVIPLWPCTGMLPGTTRSPSRSDHGISTTCADTSGHSGAPASIEGRPLLETDSPPAAIRPVTVRTVGSWVARPLCASSVTKQTVCVRPHFGHSLQGSSWRPAA